MRTYEGISTGALLVTLPVGQAGDNLDRALDHTLDLGEGGLNGYLHLGKCLGRLHPIIPDTLEPFGQRVLYLCGEASYVARGV